MIKRLFKSIKQKILSKKVLLITGLILFSLILFSSFCLVLKNSVDNNSKISTKSAEAFSEQKQTNTFTLSTNKLVRLKIPSINVNADVESVGLTSAGKMDVPKNPENVAWYKLGVKPGEIGSAVIAGHYGGWKNGEGSVFDNLHKLRKGDKLYIEDDKGMIISFVVHEIRRYDPKADASDVFGSNDGKAHLNLITCEGDWNEDSKTYPLRLVIFTDKK